MNYLTFATCETYLINGCAYHNHCFAMIDQKF